MKFGRKIIFTEIFRPSAIILTIGLGEVYTFLSSACFERETSAHARIIAKVHILESRTVG